MLASRGIVFSMPFKVILVTPIPGFSDAPGLRRQRWRRMPKMFHLERCNAAFLSDWVTNNLRQFKGPLQSIESPLLFRLTAASAESLRTEMRKCREEGISLSRSNSWSYLNPRVGEQELWVFWFFRFFRCHSSHHQTSCRASTHILEIPREIPYLTALLNMTRRILCQGQCLLFLASFHHPFYPCFSFCNVVVQDTHSLVFGSLSLQVVV